ncbi:hypothetical protein [Nocardioides jensenii]|uniref:hypothetical protein n=1 Tax=Nocardioides jensenii TaxID=1843 RepID=UPI000831B1CE|nr:hypothetical protein [Nocardioides jensenii]
MKLEFNDEAFSQLRNNPALLDGRGEAIAAACNADSEWGGYYATEPEFDGRTTFQRVFGADGRNDELRDLRLIKNLDAGQ